MALFISSSICQFIDTRYEEQKEALAEKLFSFSKPMLRVNQGVKDITVRFPEPIGMVVYDSVTDAEKDARQFVRVLAGYKDHAKYTKDSVAVFKGPVSQITNLQVYPLKELPGKTLALARVVINDELQLTGLRVREGASGLFVSYPNDPGYKGEDFRSLFYPITRELREHIEELVLKRYHEMIDNPT